MLVNGRRFVSSSTASLNGAGANNPVGGPGQQVDLNVVPTKLIDRVETISVGGAPIYGADAIAGTVNIILKKDFQGLDVDAQVGVSNQDDACNYRVRALAGQNFADGRGNITGVAEFTKTDGLTGTSRPGYAADLGFLAPANGGKYQTVLTPANSVPQVNFGGIPLVDDVFLSPPIWGVPNTSLGVTNSAGQLLAWGNQGNKLLPYNTGTQTGNPIFNEGGDGLRLSKVSNLLSPTERINADVLGNFKINDYVSAFSEGWFSETHATNLLAQPAYNAAIFGSAGTVNGNFVLNVNNPYLSPADRALIQTALNNYAANKPLGGFVDPNWNNSQFYVSRASTDLQSGLATATEVLARGVVGLNGDFTVGDRSFQLGSGAQLRILERIAGEPLLRFPERTERPERHAQLAGTDRVRRQSEERADHDLVQHLFAPQRLRRRVAEPRRPPVHHPPRAGAVAQHPAGRYRQHQRRSVQAAGRLRQARGRIREPPRERGVQSRQLLSPGPRSGAGHGGFRSVPHQRGLCRNPDSDLRAGAGHSLLAPPRGRRRGAARGQFRRR